MKVNARIAIFSVVIAGLLLPMLKRSSDEKFSRVRAAKKEWAFLEYLKVHAGDLSQREAEIQKGGALAGGDINEWIPELETLSKKNRLEIIKMMPSPASREEKEKSLQVEIELQGDMDSLGRFMFEVLELPGLVTIEKLVLREVDPAARVISAQLLLSRPGALEKI